MDKYDELKEWKLNLQENLTLPVIVKVSEGQEKSPIKYGDTLKVVSIASVDDLYGVIAVVKHKNRSYSFPLCDVQVIDQDDRNYELVLEYSDWFCNEYM